MAKLKDEVKRFIVQASACFDTPTQVAAMVKEEYGVEVGRQQVALYDPTKAAGAQLSAKWRTLFEEARAKFLDDVAAIPIANRAFRLRTLGRLAQQAERVGNMGIVVQILEQAAKEAGDVFVNRKLDPVKLPGGGELPGGTVAAVQFYLPANGRDDEIPA